ncbi:hypothetical protein ZWY2020_032112 [Hordeum vulgare]|nr:hypothetical protein ZWY2020_032112 [Hordeum vulgare]
MPSRLRASSPDVVNRRGAAIPGLGWCDAMYRRCCQAESSAERSRVPPLVACDVCSCATSRLQKTRRIIRSTNADSLRHGPPSVGGRCVRRPWAVVTTTVHRKKL